MPIDTTILTKFPGKPGVYLMKNRRGAVIYVGKAKNLKQRVRQYFVKGGDGRKIIPHLVAQVEAIETIVVTSEKEALLLENNLIKQYKPKYNALLKDDKSYIALKITKHRWPRVDIVRYRGKPKADGKYFGPYTNALAARKTLDLLQRLFPMRQCSDAEFARRTRPCLLYDIKRCVAPCVGRCTHAEYEEMVQRTVRFLKGHDKEVLAELRQQMAQHAEALEFEKAGGVLKTIQQIERTLESQKVDKPLGVDTDVLGIFREGEEVILAVMFFRGGRLTGMRHYNFHHIAQEDEGLLQTFLLQYYEHVEVLPHEILLPIKVGGARDLEGILSLDRRRGVHIHTPSRGDKRGLVQMAKANAEALFMKEKDAKTLMENTLLEMQEKFRLTRYPKQIECFDVSSISGTETVSSMVVFTDGKKAPSRYRKYKVRSVEGPDDYASMREVLMRRYQRGKEENNLPDLLIVDGGKGHLNMALKVLKELNIITIDVIGLAKERGRHDRGMTAEQVFLPNIKDPIFLKKTSSVLFLLQTIRDEAHRSAIDFHRKRRSKGLIRSALDDIQGIGPAKRKKLLVYFGSLKKIRAATLEALEQVPGLSARDAQEVYQSFRASPPSSPP